MSTKTAREIAHDKAGAKFARMLKKWPNGFDFAIATYRKDEFEEELNRINFVFSEIDESTAELGEDRISFLERLRTLNFKKTGEMVITGCGVRDLVREDFIEPDGTTHWARGTTSYAIAPTQELLDEHERTR